MNRLFYLVGQGFENIWKNKMMFLASVLIITTSMITLGVFTVIGENASEAVKRMQEEQAMVAYVKEALSEEEIKSIEANIKKVNGIVEVKRETAKEALENARKLYFNEDNIDLTIGWEENNQFTDSFSVKVEDLNNAKEISDKIHAIMGIRKVIFSEELFNTVTKLANTVKTVTMVIFILLIGISLLVISNTIKLGLHSRRKEIHIMKYIGATDSFVSFPFVVEGIIVGLTGAIISWIVTVKAYDFVKGTMNSGWGGSLLGFTPLDLDMKILKINILIGVLVSCIACVISIKKYLKV